MKRSNIPRSGYLRKRTENGAKKNKSSKGVARTKNSKRSIGLP